MRLKKQNFFYKLWRCLYPVMIHYGALMLTSILALIVVIVAVMLKVPNTDNSDMIVASAIEIYLKGAIMITGLGNALAIPLCMLFIHLDNKKYPLGKLEHPAKRLTYLFPIFAGITICIAGNFFLSLLPFDILFPREESPLDSILYGGNIWIEIIVTVFIGPVGEELAFRGLFYRRLRDYMPAWATTILVSLGFGIYHGNLLQGVYAFFVGLVLAYIYEKYQNILAPILVHVAANGVSVFLSEWTPIRDLELNVLTTFWIALVAALVLVLILLGVRRIVVLKRTERPEVPILSAKKLEKLARRMQGAVAYAPYTPYPALPQPWANFPQEQTAFQQPAPLGQPAYFLAYPPTTPGAPMVYVPVYYQQPN